MAIPEEVIERIKEQNDIVDIISEKVKLKHSGRNYLGLCPFHNEKTPSFSVSVDKQIYKCFGCGEAGNVITFVMKTKGLSYVESIEYLAEKANISIEQGKDKKVKDKKDILYKINVEAARFFFNNLNNNLKEKEYFLKRGITQVTIRRFGLGYSLNNWEELLSFLKRKGFSNELVSEAGLAIAKDKGGFYDRFRNRVMFPVFDHRGKVIGFGGRVLDDSKPKYLNSPETQIFSKRTNLYGLNFAIKDNKDRCLVIVEGYMDCISLHQVGITNVVASLGTALTVNQARLLKRYADTAIIAYDADIAGQNATLRGLDVLKGVGLDVKVLTVPDGKDPDGYVRIHGKEEFLKLISNSVPLIDYKLNRAKENKNLFKETDLIQYAKEVTEIVEDLNPIEQDIYIKKVSEQTGIKEQSFYDSVKKLNNKEIQSNKKVNSTEGFGSKSYLEPAYVKAERSLLNLMIEDIQIYEYIKENMGKDSFIIDTHKKILDFILDSEHIKGIDRYKYIESKCDDAESIKEWTLIKEVKPLDEDSDKVKVVKDYFEKIKNYRLEESKNKIMIRMKELELSGNIDESMRLTTELMKIQKAEGRE
ncbi:DNA primase [Clostridium putrefaciens]|uniref:DNA primase n=1 Tax=Clostridium putrefaciens TaxID=99675 RepID=A0A381J827_9CLOT|nr:DNA primase [Clostridium putrefaciens]SUY47420.1 DNA primase [Clostridium putrefaciens]